MVTMEQVAGSLAAWVTGSAPSNRYRLQIDNLTSSSALSVLSIHGQACLNQPWRYDVTFTSTNKQLSPDIILNQPAALRFETPPLASQSLNLSFLEQPQSPQILHGVITAFSLLSVNKDEALYQVVLQPRLARLAQYHHSAIYQNQSVVSVVESVLRGHGFTGIDYRLELTQYYPVREFITQWQESDLGFIQRLLADVGIWFRFETHSEHHCDVLVLSDSAQGYDDGGHVVYKLPSGTVDSGAESVWDIAVHSQLVPASVKVQEYNYRDGQANLQAEASTQPQDVTTQGEDYRYGEHYKVQGDESVVESGQFYAKIRHEAAISGQQIIVGKSNAHHLSVGQHVVIDGSGIEGICEGVIILSTQSRGGRQAAYELDFTAIPYEVTKPYRPAPLPWPQVSGTLPARVTSPDNDTYGYIDTLGRYRVKFNFDLKSWKNGEESLWVRLAKPYAGDTYGFHFPLIDGTEVAIAFMGGNPDRPYIAHAMHDSTHADHVTTVNKHRNVIRTPANNKLRMDDKRGQEHIKLASEYGKTQLNLGHLVNQNKQQRGEGFELRTDEWGAIAANKGLYLTAQTEPKAQGKQLDMQGAITQLENALSIAKALHNAAQTAQAHPADTPSQQQLQTALTELKQAGMIAYAPDGIALTSDENIQLSSSNSVSVTSENQTDISALQHITLSAGESASVFAHKAGMKLFANQGKVEMQAQNDAMALAAKQDIKIDSVDGSVKISAEKGISLLAGGSYIKINGGGIELGTSSNVTIKSIAMQKMGVATLNAPVINLPNVNGCSEFFILTNHETGEPLAFHPYDIEVNGQIITGVTDAKGHMQRIFTDEPQTITGTPQDNSPKNTFLARHIGSGKRVQLDFNES